MAMKHDTDPKTGNERYYQEVRSRGGLTGICLFIGGLGLLFAVGGFVARLPHVRADEYAMLVLGSLACLLAWRLWSTATGPYLILSPSKLTVRKIRGNRSWKYDDITSLASFPTVVQANLPNGRKGPPVAIHYLGIKTRDGKFSKVVLPEHSGNRALLKSLKENSLVSITSIEGEAEAFKAWGTVG